MRDVFAPERTPPEPPPVAPHPSAEPPPAPVVWSYDLVPPEESGIPPGPDEENAYGNILSDMGVADDPFASDLVWRGWFDLDEDRDARRAAREEFFDYMGWDEYEFDWDDWREWYESVSG